MYAVTETATGFFTGLGFEGVGTVAALPGPIRETALVRDHCSVSAKTLRLEL